MTASISVITLANKTVEKQGGAKEHRLIFCHFVLDGGKMDSYKTIASRGSDEFIVKKSRFIGHVCPVKTPEEAVAFINEIKSQHREATHNVYAYSLRQGQLRRYSDDGEPQGTAGMPVLDVILKENLVDVAVVVTRYFGGILLGTGGLVRAYSHGSKIALESGEIITMAMCTLGEVRCDYNFYGRLAALLPEKEAIVEDTVFESDVLVKFRISEDKFEGLNAAVVDLSNGRFHCDEKEKIFCIL